MANSATYNFQFDPSEKFVWNISFSEEDDSPVDISSYTFKFELKNSSGTIIWLMSDAGISRPNNNTIQFEKSRSEVAALAAGVYSYNFYVTNQSVIDDVWVSGTAVR